MLFNLTHLSHLGRESMRLPVVRGLPRLDSMPTTDCLKGDCCWCEWDCAVS